MRALRRRGQKSRITWPRLVALAQRWLPLPSILTGGPARLASNWMLWYRTLEPEFRSGLRYPRDRISPVDPGPLRCERCEKFIRRGAATTYVFEYHLNGQLGQPVLDGPVGAQMDAAVLCPRI